MENKKCCFCGEFVIEKDGYIVCENCKTVCFDYGYDSQTITDQIRKYIDNINRQLLKRQCELHEIEQECMLNKEACEKHSDLRTPLRKFIEIKNELLSYSSKDNLKRRRFRELLYQLMIISKELETIVNNPINIEQ